MYLIINACNHVININILYQLIVRNVFNSVKVIFGRMLIMKNNVKQIHVILNQMNMQ